jgi:hypothetical protein
MPLVRLVEPDHFARHVVRRRRLALILDPQRAISPLPAGSYFIDPVFRYGSIVRFENLLPTASETSAAMHDMDVPQFTFRKLGHEVAGKSPYHLAPVRQRSPAASGSRAGAPEEEPLRPATRVRQLVVQGNFLACGVLGACIDAIRNRCPRTVSARIAHAL